ARAARAGGGTLCRMAAGARALLRKGGGLVALIKDAEGILEGKKVKVRKSGEKFDCTSLLPDDEWYPKAVRTKIRPARWNWKDCYAKLKSIASDPIPGADRRFIILVHNDTEEMMGTAPGALIGMTILNPGEGLK